MYFPIFALVETTTPATGDKCVGHRKLLYLEKLFAALLLAAPNVRVQQQQRCDSLVSSTQAPNANAKNMLKVLSGLRMLLEFWLPAAFRMGFLVRSCCWEGRQQGSGAMAFSTIGQCLLLLVQLLGVKAAKNEYVRTLSIAILFWQPWHSILQGVCFVEEACEAML